MHGSRFPPPGAVTPRSQCPSLGPHHLASVGARTMSNVQPDQPDQPDEPDQPSPPTAPTPPAGSLQLAFPVLLITERLELRVSDPGFAEQFAEFVASSAHDFEFVPGWKAAADVQVARESLQRSLDLAHDDVVRHAFLRSTGQYVGRLDLHSWDPSSPRCELGYMGDSRHAGQGLMSEAARCMVDAVWGLDVRRVQATCDARNTRAIRFATAIGMQHEGVLRAYDRDDEGHLSDTVMLAIVRP